MRSLAAALLVGAGLIAACGSTAPPPAAPSESLQAGAYGGSPGAASTATATSPSPSPSAPGSTSPSPRAAAAASSPAGPTTPCTSCGSVANGSPATVTVDATDDDVFSPQVVSIKVGQVVEWKDIGSQAHTVTFPSDGAISDNVLSSGQTWEVKFTKAGNFYYQCNFHIALGMTGTVEVTSG
ncbi:MAG TPA: plastocyanin/azurin family copper-binding protein [Candidatus Binatia bacterium]|nr:plastocyanin/azurin family copper-binding protein [Candidatus Binatia bacterium]